MKLSSKLNYEPGDTARFPDHQIGSTNRMLDDVTNTPEGELHRMIEALGDDAIAASSTFDGIVIGSSAPVTRIARACHIANAVYCSQIEDVRPLPWSNAQSSLEKGVAWKLSNPDATPLEQHDAWLSYRALDGWVYGEARDEELKTHPYMVPHSELPEAQHTKDLLFAYIVKKMAGSVPAVEPVEQGDTTVRCDLYDGKADERQSSSPEVEPQYSLFRKRYRQIEPDEIALHDAIKDKADELAHLYRQVTSICNRRGVAQVGETTVNIDLAVRHLEDSVYRSVKALTS